MHVFSQWISNALHECSFSLEKRTNQSAWLVKAPRNLFTSRTSAKQSFCRVIYTLEICPHFYTIVKKWLYLQEEVEITVIQRNLRGVSELVASGRHQLVYVKPGLVCKLLLVYFRKAVFWTGKFCKIEIISLWEDEKRGI